MESQPNLSISLFLDHPRGTAGVEVSIPGNLLQPIVPTKHLLHEGYKGWTKTIIHFFLNPFNQEVERL